MRNIGRIVYATALLALSVSCAWCYPTVTWTDAYGPQSVNLTFAQNPNWSHDLTNREDKYVWQGGLWITMNSSATIQLNVTGNFTGTDGKVWKQLRLGLYIGNQIPSPPNKISRVYVNIVNNDGKLYNIFGIPATWNWNNTSAIAGDFSASSSTYYILNGQTLITGVKFWGNVDPITGNGTMTFTVRPTLAS